MLGTVKRCVIMRDVLKSALGPRLCPGSAMAEQGRTIDLPGLSRCKRASQIVTIAIDVEIIGQSTTTSDYYIPRYPVAL